MKKIFIIIALAFSICSCNKFSGNIKSIDEGIITKIDTSSYIEITLDKSQISYTVPNTKDYVYEQDLFVGIHVFICERDGKLLISILSPKQMQLAKEVALDCKTNYYMLGTVILILLISIASSIISTFGKRSSKHAAILINIIFLVIVPFLITYYMGRIDTLEFVTSGKVEQVADNQIFIGSKYFPLSDNKDVISKQPLQNISSACILKYQDKYYATAENMQNIDGSEIYKIRYTFLYAIFYFIVYFIFNLKILQDLRSMGLR